MALFYPPDDETNVKLLAWAASRIGDDTIFGREDKAIGVIRKDALAAVVVYSAFSGSNCMVSFAADDPKWATKQTIGTLLMHPFDQYGCYRITAIVRTNNPRARKLLEGLGFKHEGTLRDYFYPHNAQIYGLRARDFHASAFYRSVAIPKPDVTVELPPDPPRLCQISATRH